ncbi:MAG: DNA methylase, partial [Bacilli bacterium]|nr:DNA methylase [Bacilli bacterium]
FYSDYDNFLSAISKKMKDYSISVWTLGNRKIAKQEILMNDIMTELCSQYQLRLATSFSRKILNKRMPGMNAYTGESKSTQTTMTREHILVFIKEALADE